MARPTRVVVFAALWAKLQAIDAGLAANLQFVTKSLRVQAWEDVPEMRQPALFFEAVPQSVSQAGGFGLPAWRWPGVIWIYYKVEATDDQGEAPIWSTQAYLDAVEATLAPDVSGKQTLGGLVNHCWIDGMVPFNEGRPGLDNQAVIMVPITISIGN